MTTSTPRTGKRRYARLTPAAWAEIEGLWASGAATLAEVAQRYGVSARAVQSRMASRGVQKGAAAEALAAEVRGATIARALPAATDLAARAAEIRTTAIAGAERVERMMLAALDAAAADPGKIFALNATAKALALAAQVFEKTAKKALAYRKLARDGGDPLAERCKEKATVPTFAEAAERVHEEHKASWANPKHAAQWINTLTTYAIPHFGTRRVDQIETPDVLRALSAIWMTKPETARRVRQRIGTVFNWAKAAGYRSGENPVEGVAKGLPKQTDEVEHHAALPYVDVPAFVARLRDADRGEVTKLAFEFLILTALRTNEVLGARWEEIDVVEGVWTVPAKRMKMKRVHRLPLSPRALVILARAKELAADSPFAFPGQKAGKPLSNMAFEMTLRRMKVAVTAHGFRSSFRDWAAEATSYPNEVAEMALAHVVKNRVEAAYRRGDLLEKRRGLMDDWATFCAGGLNPK